LLTGETGTGKEVYARAIHYRSPRACQPFLPVNCGAIPLELVENELFGHERGAYTNASAFQTGLIEEANSGTLFLDEIDCLPVLAQVKLLRFLQEKEYKPLGSTRTRRADVRIIAASNLDLQQAVGNGKLRQDLFYRLNTISLILPPLRERREDIPLLARYFLAKYTNEFGRQPMELSPEALHLLTVYNWPGNVRELEHVIERAIVLCEGSVLEAGDLVLSVPADNRESPQEAKAKEIARFEKKLYSRSPLRLPWEHHQGGAGSQVSGNLSQVLIRHCTLVPGWSIDSKCNPENETEPSLQLTDTSAELQIENSILGSIVINQNEVTTDPIIIRISDSILDAARNDLDALSGPETAFAHADVTILRSTVFGLVRTHSITLAENSIFNGRVTVVRSQRGCMRFCYVPPGSRTPRRFHCQPDGVESAATERLREIARMVNAPPPTQSEIEAAQQPERERVRPRFNSVRYGTPMYCQLAETCALEIKQGADDESEMGVLHDLFQPQREANLRARLDEYALAGMDAGLIFVT